MVSIFRNASAVATASPSAVWRPITVMARQDQLEQRAKQQRSDHDQGVEQQQQDDETAGEQAAHKSTLIVGKTAGHDKQPRHERQILPGECREQMFHVVFITVACRT